MNNDNMQTRDTPGAQVRRQSRRMDVVRVIREARLPDVQRGCVIEYVNTAHVRDTREDLGGARYLQRVAREMPDLPRLRRTMRQLATAFVHPDLKATSVSDGDRNVVPAGIRKPYGNVGPAGTNYQGAR
jgi:hypothetical protein